MEQQLRQGPTLIESLWRHRVVVVLVVVVSGALGYLVSAQQAPSYEATASLILTNPNTAVGPGEQFGPSIAIDEYVPQQAALLSSQTVLLAALDAVEDPPTLRDLRESLQIRAAADQLTLTVTTSAEDPERSAALANAIADAYRTLRASTESERAQDAVASLEDEAAAIRTEIDAQQDVLETDPDSVAAQTRVQTLSSQLESLESDIRATSREYLSRGDGVYLFEAAEAPEEPAAPRPRLMALVVAFLGFVGVAAWAYWYAARSQRVMTRRDPEAVLGVPLLGEVPLFRTRSDDALNDMLRIDPAAAEAYEFVLSSIEFALAEVDGSSLLITSTLPGDGKTTTTLQLAIAASRDRRRVVLVDADIRARGLTKVLRAEDREGLSDLAAMDLEPSDVMRRYRFSDQSQIPIVTAGRRRGDPAALLRTHAFRRAVAAIDASAELLIVDSSPLLAVADATIAAGLVDAMVIVVSQGTPVSELQKVRERLKFVSTPLLGYVFNRSDATTAGAYGYGYDVSEDVDGTRRLLPGGRDRAAAPERPADRPGPAAGPRRLPDRTAEDDADRPADDAVGSTPPPTRAGS
ncbi:Wzz/FepE/Etk N-terminal domain-containing protein [Euzebya sp.]|uniref:tyrosine-protein kinase domain-containing protein n=1 Tax=Euzebya sp. TaxID=1971409 RepID=UPI003518DCC2